jgi:hypothetical protein
MHADLLFVRTYCRRPSCTRRAILRCTASSAPPLCSSSITMMTTASSCSSALASPAPRPYPCCYRYARIYIASPALPQCTVHRIHSTAYTQHLFTCMTMLCLCISVISGRKAGGGAVGAVPGPDGAPGAGRPAPVRPGPHRSRSRSHRGGGRRQQSSGGRGRDEHAAPALGCGPHACIRTHRHMNGTLILKPRDNAHPSCQYLCIYQPPVMCYIIQK